MLQKILRVLKHFFAVGDEVKRLIYMFLLAAVAAAATDVDGCCIANVLLMIHGQRSRNAASKKTRLSQDQTRIQSNEAPTLPRCCYRLASSLTRATYPPSGVPSSVLMPAPTAQ